MPHEFAKLRKLPDPRNYYDQDHYDDPYVFYTNTHLYQHQGEFRPAGELVDRSILYVYPKDVEIILGMTPRQAMRFITEIRDAIAMMPTSFCSIGHFCDYTGIDNELLMLFFQESR